MQAADIAGYSALVGADDERTVRALKGHQAAVLPLLAREMRNSYPANAARHRSRNVCHTTRQ